MDNLKYVSDPRRLENQREKRAGTVIGRRPARVLEQRNQSIQRRCRKVSLSVLCRRRNAEVRGLARALLAQSCVGWKRDRLEVRLEGRNDKTIEDTVYATK